MLGHVQLLAHLSKGQVGGQQRKQAQLSGGERCRGDDIAAEAIELGAELAGLVREGAEVGPPPQQVVDLAQDLSGGGHVGQGEVGTGQLQPGLDRVIRQRIGSLWPQLLARARSRWA